MARPVLLIAGAGLFAGLVVAYGAFAWIETERRVLGAAEAEGRAVLQSVAAGVRSSLDAGTAVESLLSRRLFDLATQMDSELADEPGDLESPLVGFVQRHGLRGAVVLDSDFAVRAAGRSTGLQRWSHAERLIDLHPSAEESRLAHIEAELLAARVRDRGLATEDRVTFGFGEAPFSTRPEYLVGAKARHLRGFVLLRQDAAELDSFQRQAGVSKLLKDAAAGPGVAYLVVEGADGRVLAASDPARVGTAMPPVSEAAVWQPTSDGGRVLDVSLPVGDARLRVGLAAGPVEEHIARGRANVIIFSLTSLAAAAVVVVLLVLRSRRVAELEERERFASLGRLAAGVAHEVRSPLNALSMAAQRLQREAAPTTEPERTKFVELTAALRSGIARLDGTIREFLTLGRDGPPPERTPIDVAALVEEVLAAESVDARRDPPAAPLVVVADRALLAKALANLVRNAHQIAPGTVAVKWRREGGSAVVEVTDGGPGIAPPDRERVFEPFFTKRPGGTGLGLAICRDSVERQGGRVVVDGSPQGGARFAIELPAEGA